MEIFHDGEKAQCIITTHLIKKEAITLLWGASNTALMVFNRATGYADGDDFHVDIFNVDI